MQCNDSLIILNFDEGHFIGITHHDKTGIIKHTKHNLKQINCIADCLQTLSSLDIMEDV